MDIKQVFARNLRKHRLARGLSQEALAHEAGLDRSYVSSLECSIYSVSITTVEDIAKVLGVETYELLVPHTK